VFASIQYVLYIHYSIIHITYNIIILIYCIMYKEQYRLVCIGLIPDTEVQQWRIQHKSFEKGL